MLPHLAPHNILFENNNKFNVTLKIADFSFVPSLQLSLPCRMDIDMCDSWLYMVCFCGCHHFFLKAPEILALEPFDERSSLWSLGVMMYEWLCGIRPFNGKNPMDLLRNINKSPNIVVPGETKLSKSCIELLRGLLHPCATKRMSMDDFLQHSFFTKNIIYKTIEYKNGTVEFLWPGKQNTYEMFYCQDGKWIGSTPPPPGTKGVTAHYYKNGVKVSQAEIIRQNPHCMSNKSSNLEGFELGTIILVGTLLLYYPFCFRDTSGTGPFQYCDTQYWCICSFLFAMGKLF